MKALKLILAAITCSFLLLNGAAQELPDDLTAVPAGTAPPSGCIYFSLSHFGVWAPTPFPLPTVGDLYYSPSMLSTGMVAFFIDDLESHLMNTSESDPLLPPGFDPNSTNNWSPPDYTPPTPPPPSDFGTNLWLVISNLSGQVVPLGILNTTGGVPYEVISSPVLTAPLSNWISECVVMGVASNTPALVEMGSRTNHLFFRARSWDATFQNGYSTNGEIYLQVQSSPIHPVINGFTNTLSAWYSNWVVINPSSNIFALNLGYDGSDGGPLNPPWVTTNASQGILTFLGFSKTITNLCISSNNITSLNLSGWPALQSVDAWHCISNLTVSVTNCPQLARTCFEALQGENYGLLGTLDYSGCSKIAEIRAADNRLSNVIFANGAGPEVWHLCIHDNTVNTLPQNFNFNVFPSMRELWVWDNQFNSALTLNTANGVTNLQSVEAFNNNFPSIDVSGQTNLDHITMYGNVRMTNVNITGCTTVREIDWSGNGLSQTAVDHVLITLDQSGPRSAGSALFVKLDLGSNAVPSLDGQRAALNLFNKGWTVSVNPPSAGTPSISSVSVPAIGSNSATITWTTDIASDSTVYYSTTQHSSAGSYSSTNISGSVTSHSVTVTGLSAATGYYFFVRSTSGAYTGTSADYQFTTRGGPGIYFVHTSTTVSMQVAVTGSPSVSWLWGDGGATVGFNTVNHNFTTNTVSSVVVNPASALVGFGVFDSGCNPTTALDQVTGLTNYPNLQDLYLYQSGLTNLSLAGCSNLVSIALVSTSPSSAVENAWFNDLSASQPVMPGGSVRLNCGNLHVFYFPTTPGTNSSSAVACSNLTHQAGVNGHWDLQHYP